MKHLLCLMSMCLFGTFTLTQQIPTGSGGFNNNNFWSKGGNNGGAGSGNIFGTRWNSPIYFITGGLTQATYRARLNGTLDNVFQYQVNGYNYALNGVNGINTSGYFGLGFNEDFIWSQNAGPGQAAGPFSLLHLNGRDGTFVQQGGFRPWMKTGITFTDNNDLSYMGLRKIGAGNDITETAIVWSDNALPGIGPDDLVFRFTGFGVGGGNPDDATSVTNNLQTPWDFDGLHVARFTGLGNFGLGNTFGVNVPGQAVQYATPQSLQHMSLSDLRSVWSQYTNRATNLGSGTGENANDGLRVGINGNINIQRNGNAFIYNQENRHLLFSTNANTNFGGVASMNNTRERMRITRIGAPTNIAAGYGVWNPAGLPANTTRTSISHNPNNAVTRPMALLHLGYNTGSLLNPFSTDGWRNWMDVGMFIADDTDNMYVGMMDMGNDRKDAVISWGDNPIPAFGIGPDYLRIIFTSTQTPPFGSGPGQANQGLEMARYDPTQDVNNNPNNPNNAGFGKMGVGDFTNNQVTHKIHVRGNGRFEYVPDQATDYVLMAFQEDANNPDDISLRKVHIDSLPTAVIDTAYVDCDSTDLVIIQNGDSLIVDLDCIADTTGGIGTGFVPCSDITGVANLPEDSKVNMNDFDIYFEDGPDSLNQFTGNTIGVGYDCGENFPGKVSVDNKSEHVGVYVVNDGITDVGNWPNTIMAGVSSTMRNSSALGGPGGFIAPVYYGLSENNAQTNLGIFLECRNGPTNTGGVITAGDFVNTSVSNNGLRVSAVNGTLQNRGVSGAASSAPGSTTAINFGVDGVATGDGTNYGTRGTAIGSGDCYGVYGTSNSSGVGTDDFAGYFDGLVYIMGTVFPSDQNMKTNINDYDSSLYILSQLEPKTFEFTDANFQGMNLPEGHQYGFVAQDVEQILPAVVTDNTHPAQYDSLGNIIQPAYDFKGIDYEAFIPILVGGVQEQQSMIEEQDSIIQSQDSLINDLNTRLTDLENCLSNILPLLCQINNLMINQNDKKTQEQLRDIINVELNDDQNIVLDQNVPNPFAEQTVINFSIPETVRQAQIHFYNAAGQLIKTVDVQTRGLGSLNVFGADLSTGIYTYSLVADGVIVATKKMQKMNY